LPRGELRGQIGELRMELVIAIHGVVKWHLSAIRTGALYRG
jgi:hypothetical protein